MSHLPGHSWPTYLSVVRSSIHPSLERQSSALTRGRLQVPWSPRNTNNYSELIIKVTEKELRKLTSRNHSQWDQAYHKRDFGTRWSGNDPQGSHCRIVSGIWWGEYIEIIHIGKNPCFTRVERYLHSSDATTTSSVSVSSKRVESRILVMCYSQRFIVTWLSNCANFLCWVQRRSIHVWYAYLLMLSSLRDGRPIFREVVHATLMILT